MGFIFMDLLALHVFQKHKVITVLLPSYLNVISQRGFEWNAAGYFSQAPLRHVTCACFDV